MFCNSFRISEYSSSQTVTVITGTWNVNGKFSNLESIDSWILLNHAKNPDMFVIGIQELIELSPGSVGKILHVIISTLHQILKK